MMNQESRDYLKNLKKTVEKDFIKKFKTLNGKSTFKDELDEFYNVFDIACKQNFHSIKLNSKNLRPMGKHYNHFVDRELGESNSCYLMSTIKERLNKMVVLKLAGGLGTSMNCSKPKVSLELRTPENSKITLLHYTVMQIIKLNEKYQANIPLIFLTSFYTHSYFENEIKKYKNERIKIYLVIQQSQYPRLVDETFTPLLSHLKNEGKKTSVDDDFYYNPPGHATVFRDFVNSRVYDKLLSDGKEYLFFSNVSNLGASLEINIMNLVFEKNMKILLEVTNKTKNDVKGGALYVNKNNQVIIYESAEVTKEQFEQNAIFNTGNTWVKIKEIKKRLNDLRSVPVIVNKKKVKGITIIQLEQSCNRFLQFFENPYILKVERKRISGLKLCRDYFLFCSSLFCFSIGHDFIFRRADEKSKHIPTVFFNGSSMNTIEKFWKIFKTIPNISNLQKLIIDGDDIEFGENIILEGEIFIKNEKGKKISFPSNITINEKTEIKKYQKNL